MDHGVSAVILNIFKCDGPAEMLWLLKKGCNPKAYDTVEEVSALWQAAREGRTCVVKLSLDAGADKVHFSFSANQHDVPCTSACMLHIYVNIQKFMKYC